MLTSRIFIPEALDLPSVLNFCNSLDSLPDASTYIIDYKNMGNVEPCGMLIMGSRIRRLIKEKEYINFKGENYTNNDYAAHMGFYKSIFLDYGKSPGEAKGSSTYLPITKVEIADFINESFRRAEHVVDTVERNANQIAGILARQNQGVQKSLTYSIREIMRNVLEHSGASSIWYAGQYWPSKDRVEIAILDEGMGVYSSLKRNKKLKLSDTKDALYLALEPGISGKDIKVERKRDEIYGNSGYGLFMTSRMCEDGGDFVIGSGDTFLGITSKSNYLFSCSISGTVIRMRLRASKIENLQQMISKYLTEGAERERKHTKSNVLSASQSSRLLLNEQL